MAPALFIISILSAAAGAWCLHGWLINRAASRLDPLRPKTREYYLSPFISHSRLVSGGQVTPAARAEERDF